MLAHLLTLCWQAVGMTTTVAVGQDPNHYDLLIIGAGSGNSIINEQMDGWRVAMVERGLFGGTCLNVGCIPSKMLIYPADLALHAADEHTHSLGVSTTFQAANWPAIVQRVFGRIDPIAEGGRQYRHGLSNVDVFEHDARFVGPRAVRVGDRTLTADRVVIAAGARSNIPDLPGLADVPFHTSDTLLRVPQQPRHLVILGGGFIAAELGHVFQALGSKVTIINRGHQLLTAEDFDISRRFTELSQRRFDLHLGARIESVSHRRDDATSQDMFSVALRDASDGHSGLHVVEGDALLVAVGRVGNGRQLDVAAAGVALDADGWVTVDEFGRTSADGVWALGDVNGRHQLKHMANGEARVVQHNLLHPTDLQPLDRRPAPHAVFTHPQIGAVGMTERQADGWSQRSGGRFVAISHDYAGAAYGWAMEDTSSFCKLIGDPATRTLLGAHVIGHQASILVQLLVQGMHLGATVDEMATGQVWIHPALSEVVEQALLKLRDAFDAFDADR
jgi:mycothione reductase